MSSWCLVRSITSVVTLALLAANALCIAFAGWSKWPHVAYFLFFRLSYDVGLGALLRAQSENKTFTRWYDRQLQAVGGVKSRHWVARLFHHLAASQVVRSPSQHALVDVDSYPTAFRAWLVYKNLVNVILINDGLNYLLLGVKCFHLPSDLSWLVMLQYSVGGFLGLFNWSAQHPAQQPAHSTRTPPQHSNDALLCSAVLTSSVLFNYRCPCPVCQVG